jgi:hypothetical protein
LRIAERSREFARFGPRKPALAIVEKNGHGLPRPGGRENKIDSVIAVNIPRLDRQAARGSNELQRVTTRCRQLELDRVAGRGSTFLAALDTGKIKALVAIEIGYRERWSGSYRAIRNAAGIWCSTCPCDTGGKETK